jgi:Domain of unknown function (DUF4157)
MGRTLGADFGHVRVHTDAKADLIARSLWARAFTVGRESSSARTSTGRRLRVAVDCWPTN